MKVLFAAAEFAPVSTVGGLASAASGLVGALRDAGVDVIVVLPDYEGWALAEESSIEVRVPEWARPARVRRGRLAGVGDVVLVDVPGISRSHPYLSATGHGWPDNDRRFFAFSAVVASLCDALDVDVLHLNDWHTATALAHVQPAPPTVYTIHNLAYQGVSDRGWLDAFPRQRDAFDWNGACNPVAGALRLADAIVAVSPNYAEEIRTAAAGMGLDGLLRDRADALVGIINGIDLEVWDPTSDPALVEAFGIDDTSGKDRCRDDLRAEAGLEDPNDVLIGMVTRLTDQKGVDLALACAPYLEGLRAQLFVLGSGDASLVRGLHDAAAAHPGRVAFRDGYDEALSHRVFAGSDLLLMPSRFEPCGLAQMQAMRYGTIPVVTDVGGLHDTVTDADREATGTGFVAAEPTQLPVLDAVHRAVRASRHRQRRDAIRRRGMAIDWSWNGPARRYLDVYEAILGR